MKNSSIVSFFRKYWFVAGIIGLVLVKHSFLAEMPFVARSNYPHDDTLFLANAISLLSGEWFGPLNQITLLRGPFYPFWIIFVYIIGLPLIHANDLLYLGACLVVIRALLPLIKSRWVMFIIFVFLYMAPHSYNYATISHSFRMSIYPSLALLTLGAALGLSIRLICRGQELLTWSLLLAFSFTFFWYVREEGVWLLPALLLLLLYTVFAGKLETRRFVSLVRTLLFFVMVPGLFFTSVTGVIKYMNNKYYGEPIVLDIKTPEYKRAYNAMLSVRAPEPKRYVHVTRESLEQMYAVSPKMNELREHLDRYGRRLNFDRELPAATFFFSFRDSVARAGYYKKGLSDVLAYYDDLGAELEQACQEGKLNCGKLVYPLVPLWQAEFTKDLPLSFIRQFDLLVRFPEFRTYTNQFYSVGDTLFFYRVSRLLHAPLQATKTGLATWPFPQIVRDIKLDVLDEVGELIKLVRLVLFYLCLILLVWFIISDLRDRRVTILPLFGVCVLGAICGLVVVITIIDVTSFHSLFRARHGAAALVSLFVITVLAEWHRRRTDLPIEYI
jgi:hypothetical protein